MPTAPAKKPAAKKAAPAKKAAAKKPAPAPVAERRALNVWYIGNFEPPHSTENHVARAMRNQGWAVECVQENDISQWPKMLDALDNGTKPDVILWTRTGWPWEDYKVTTAQMHQTQLDLISTAEIAGIAVVGYHLDIWWGLRREHEVYSEPFFKSTLVVTADGGHDSEWGNAGVNHLWFPPAVSAAEAQVGQRRNEFVSRLAFVGSHDGDYHPEHQHRHELVAWLKSNFGRSGENAVRFWPEPGQHAIRGRDLQDLYASVDVVVGDSCFAGTGLANYWSDRIPETLGRGGYLLHPDVPGLEGHFTNGVHLGTWQAGDWDHLGRLIETSLGSPEVRRMIRGEGRAHVLANHTYEVRMAQLETVLREKGLLK